LGTVGVIRQWICDFTKIAKPLMVLTKKMVPHEFEWTEEAQDAMELLKHLATTAIPVRSLDYELAHNVQPPDQRDNELGLVTVHVDSLIISVGWMIAQCLTDMEYLIVFSSITFNEHEACYSQPKLELYGVFRALKAECHRLHNIHFCLTINVGFLVWITYIQLFTFEVNHTLGTAHHIPDGLSHQPHMADDSDYSNGDVDIKDGIKLVRALPIEIESISSVEEEAKNGICVHEALSQSKLKQVPGKVKALECRWASPELLLHDYRRMYTRVREEIDIDTEYEKLTHQHCVQDMDSEEYWDEILSYLHLKWLPNSQNEAEKLKRHAMCYFILNGSLWHRNGGKPPLLVVLNKDVRMRITRDAHDDAGHRGQDLTF